MKKHQRAKRVSHKVHIRAKVKIKQLNRIKNSLLFTFTFIVIFGILAFFVSKIYGFFFYAPSFMINYWEIKGGPEELNIRVRRICRTMFTQNFFLLSAKGIEKRIVSLCPEISTVTLDRFFPNRVRLNLNLRKPVGYVLENGIYQGIDDQAILFPVKERRNLPIIKSKERFNEITYFLAWLYKTDMHFFSTIKEISVTDVQGIYLNLSDDTTIFWGKETDPLLWQEKYRSWKLVYHEFREKGKPLAYADLRFYPESGIVILPRNIPAANDTAMKNIKAKQIMQSNLPVKLKKQQ